MFNTLLDIIKVKDKENLVSEFEKQFGISNLRFENSLSENRLKDLWYGGTIIAFDYKDKEVHISAIGDVDCELYWLENGKIIDNENIVDKSESGYLGTVLWEHGIRNDNEIYSTCNLVDIEEVNNSEHYNNYKVIIDFAFGNNNWIEIYYFDKNGGNHNDNETWSLEEAVTTNFEEVLKYIDKIED